MKRKYGYWQIFLTLFITNVIANLISGLLSGVPFLSLFVVALVIWVQTYLVGAGMTRPWTHGYLKMIRTLNLNRLVILLIPTLIFTLLLLIPGYNNFVLVIIYLLLVLLLTFFSAYIGLVTGDPRNAGLSIQAYCREALTTATKLLPKTAQTYLLKLYLPIVIISLVLGGVNLPMYVTIVVGLYYVLSRPFILSDLANYYFDEKGEPASPAINPKK